jgi:hypothetical protein
MSILNYRNYLGGLLRYDYGNILILTVTEYDAKKNHMVKSSGGSMAIVPGQCLPPMIGPDGSGMVYPT